MDLVVPDASVILKWALPSDEERDADRALALRGAITNDHVRALVPSLWLYEVGNTVARRFPDDAGSWLAALLRFGLQEAPVTSQWLSTVVELTGRYDVSFFRRISLQDSRGGRTAPGGPARKCLNGKPLVGAGTSCAWFPPPARVDGRNSRNGDQEMRKTLLGLLATAAIAAPMGANAAFISYSLSVTDLGSPSTFGFLFGTPIVPITGLASFTFSGSFTLTDAGTDGVSVTPDGLPEFWQLGVGFPNVVVDDVGGTATLFGPGPHVFSSSGVFDCASIGGCEWLQIAVQFRGSGGDDLVQSTGTFTLEPLATVPEPGVLALLGLALAGLGLSRRKRPG